MRRALPEHWSATGWIIRDGRCSQVTCFLPAGVSATAWLHKGKWWWRIERAKNRVSKGGPCRNRSIAIRECEETMIFEMRRAIRLLRPGSRP